MIELHERRPRFFTSRLWKRRSNKWNQDTVHRGYCGVTKLKRDLFACSVCLAFWYCGKACQRQGWKQVHKQSCLRMKDERIHIPDSCLDSSEMPEFPMNLITLPPALTGLEKKVLCVIPAWDMDVDRQRDFLSSCLSSGGADAEKAKLVKASSISFENIDWKGLPNVLLLKSGKSAKMMPFGCTGCSTKG